MSVINKMLQDLENRGSDDQSMNADYQPPQKKSPKILIIVLILLAIVAILYALFMPTTNSKFTTPLENKAVSEQASIIHQAKPMLYEPIKQTTITQTIIADNTPSKDQLTNQELAPVVQIKANFDSLKKTDNTDNNNQLAIAEVEQLGAQEQQEQPEPNTIVESREPSTPSATSSFKMTNNNQETKLIDLKQKIAEHLAQGNNTQALVLLSQLVTQQPQNIKARKKLASIHFAQGNPNQAKMLLSKGIELFPDNSDLRVMLARVFVIQNQSDKALQMLINYQPPAQDKEFLAYRAALAQQLKRVDLARADYLALTKLNPNNAKWWLGLGIIEDQAGNSSQALGAYKYANQANQLEANVLEFVQQRILILESK